MGLGTEMGSSGLTASPFLAKPICWFSDMFSFVGPLLGYIDSDRLPEDTWDSSSRNVRGSITAHLTLCLGSPSMKRSVGEQGSTLWH